MKLGMNIMPLEDAAKL